jgi:hypothetical protein
MKKLFLKFTLLWSTIFILPCYVLGVPTLSDVMNEASGKPPYSKKLCYNEACSDSYEVFIVPDDTKISKYAVSNAAYELKSSIGNILYFTDRLIEGMVKISKMPEKNKYSASINYWKIDGKMEEVNDHLAAFSTAIDVSIKSTENLMNQEFVSEIDGALVKELNDKLAALKKNYGILKKDTFPEYKQWISKYVLKDSWAKTMEEEYFKAMPEKANYSNTITVDDIYVVLELPKNKSIYYYFIDGALIIKKSNGEIILGQTYEEFLPKYKSYISETQTKLDNARNEYEKYPSKLKKKNVEKAEAELVRNRNVFIKKYYSVNRYLTTVKKYSGKIHRFE